MRVPDYTVIVLQTESFAWSQINHASNETSTQNPDVGRGMWASLAISSEKPYKLRDEVQVTSSERRLIRDRRT